MDQFTALGSLADPVRRQVYEYVAAHDEPVGREQAASDTGLPLHTVRFHLERLVEEGLLETEFRRLSGRRGPPTTSCGCEKNRNPDHWTQRRAFGKQTRP